MDQQLQTPSRPRATSHALSFKSDKSGSNGGKDHILSSADKADKARRDSFLRGESKANPNAAVQEAQPATRNVFEKVTLESVRNVNAKDAQGNIISEPDLSNPLRSRWERPLDTIRSFERAVDGDYHRRTTSRANSDFERTPQQYSNRNSYYGGNNDGSRANGHYGHRSDGYDGSAPHPRARYSRGGSGYYNGQSPQYQYGNGSHEGSDSTGPWGNGTDPSSQNSSYERLHGIGGKQRGQSPEHYGMNDYSSPINEEVDDYGFPARQQQQQQRRPVGQNYQQPSQEYSAPRQPISLGNSTGSPAAYQKQGGSLPPSTRSPQEKQKGWLSRRFSKSQK